MTDEVPSIDQGSMYADAFYSGVQIVTEYMKCRSVTIQAVQPKNDTRHRDEALQGLWQRSLAWMLTLERLNHAKYFQAIVAGNRALLEIAVDIILLHKDKSNLSGWKLHSWAESEKLKAASHILRFLDEAGEVIPDEYRPLKDFVQRQKTIIEKRRQDLWGKTTHPPRWTGKSNLFEDVVHADQLFSKEIQQDLKTSLTRYYRTEYPRMNWQIHSGTAAFGNLPPQAFSILCAMAYKWSADLAMFSTKIVLADFGFLEVLPGLTEDWENVRKRRLISYGEKMYPDRSDEENR